MQALGVLFSGRTAGRMHLRGPVGQPCWAVPLCRGSSSSLPRPLLRVAGGLSAGSPASPRSSSMARFRPEHDVPDGDMDRGSAALHRPSSLDLLQAAERYVELCRSGGDMSRGELAAALHEVVSDTGICFLSDGVVYQRDRFKTIAQLVESIHRAHATFEHEVYRPVAIAANDDEDVVFVAVQFALRAKDGSRRLSRGLLIEKLGISPQDDKIVSSLVARQMTQDEAETLLLDPAQWRPALFDDASIESAAAFSSDPDEAAAERSAICAVLKAWVEAWDSSGTLHDAEPPRGVDEILDPDVRMLDCYGLSPHAPVVWEGAQGACEALRKARSTLQNKNAIVAFAVATDRKLAFEHWRATPVELSSGRTEPLEGLGLVELSRSNKIKAIYHFTLRNYPNVRTLNKVPVS